MATYKNTSKETKYPRNIDFIKFKIRFKLHADLLTIHYRYDSSIGT